MDAVSVSELVSRYGGNLPRYTSYPTAASFSEAVGSGDMKSWLRGLAVDLPVSLYFHVPFCDELCRFCGCNTSVMRHEDGRLAYGDLLREEMRRGGALMDGPRVVRHLQFGGGTPTTLPASSLRQLMRAARTFFRIAEEAELAMEMDPRHVPQDYPALLGDLGFNRISLGVQDLDEKVQEACGRHQSFEQTQSCIEQVRAAGVTGVNIDLIYGLPYQTVESVGETARRIASLRPDRLAVFGYAHIPWKQKRQKLIPEDALPPSPERLAQRARIDEVLQDAGYQPIGLDHYALPDDALARAASAGTLHRNFQGYTTDSCPVLLGMGASSISMTPTGFAQNIPTVAPYARALADSADLPVARGVACTADDRCRAAIIERIMCDLAVDLCSNHIPDNPGMEGFEEELADLQRFERDGLIERSASRIQVTEKGRPFLRNVAAVFDTRQKELAEASVGKAPSPRFSGAL